MTVNEASKLLEIVYSKAKGISSDYRYDHKILTNQQMHKCINAKKRGHLMIELDYDTILCETLNILEKAIADGNYTQKSVERFQKSSFDVLLRLSQTEGYFERFKCIIEPQERQGEALV